VRDSMGHELATDPIELLREWMRTAEASDLEEVSAMALATANAHGQPSLRFVLLKEILATGVLFATNYGSRKAIELEANPHAAAVLYWQPLHRQIRIEGQVERATDEQSDRIFAARPREARIGAWASVCGRDPALSEPATRTSSISTCRKRRRKSISALKHRIASVNSRASGTDSGPERRVRMRIA
jgi:pyridoxamine-phosphate oxidase